MQIDLSGKVAIVTGGSRGLGRADALALAEAGADVVIADILVESDTEVETSAQQYGMLSAVMQQSGVVYAEKTSSDIRAMGRNSVALKCDVTDRARVQEVVEQVKAEFGGVHILINNAATLDHTAQIHQQVPEMWERDLKVNLTGAFNFSQAVWPTMREQKWGRVIGMSSVAGMLGGFGQASYSVTKAGITGLMKTLALEGAKYNITANAIVPGVIRSEAFKMSEQVNAGMTERMIARTAFKRAGEPEDIANAIVFLCSEQASYITGIELPITGGIDLFTF